MLGLCSSIVETTCKIDVSLMTQILVHQWPVTGSWYNPFSKLIPAFLAMDCQSSPKCNAEFFNNMSPKKQPPSPPPRESWNGGLVEILELGRKMVSFHNPSKN
jgi:hypothetical protein